MRLLALVTDGFGSAGGIARYNQDLLSALAQSDRVSQIVAVPRYGTAIGTIPTKIVQVPSSQHRVSWSGRALALAVQGSFDAVFCGHLNAAPLAALIARRLHKPLWIQVHGIEAWAPRGPVSRKALTSAALVTSVSRFTRKKLLAWADVPPHRVRVLPNTVSSDYHPRLPREDLISRYGLSGKRVILTVGRLSSGERYKGHDRIIRAMPAILKRVPEAAYLIVGSGDDEGRLQILTQSLSVERSVVFAGQVRNEELGDHFALGRVFAMPSTGEGFGIVFLEAAACELPVIGGNRDGSADALADGTLGTLIDPDDAQALVAALCHGLEKGPSQSLPQALQRFSVANFNRQVDELVRSLH